MAHRDDHAAALARADALARDLARERKRAEKAERKLAAMKAAEEARARGETAPKPKPAPPTPVVVEAPPQVDWRPSPRPWRGLRRGDGSTGGMFYLTWLLVFLIAAGAVAAMLAIIG